MVEEAGKGLRVELAVGLGISGEVNGFWRVIAVGDRVRVGPDVAGGDWSRSTA